MLGVAATEQNSSKRCQHSDYGREQLSTFSYWRRKEARLPPYYGRTRHLESRPYLVTLLEGLCEQFDLSTVVRHLSLALLDYFNDKHAVRKSRMKLVALGSIIVAAKHVGPKDRVPLQSDLNHYALSPEYSRKDYLQIELALLKHFRWNINIPTPAHFIDYFLGASITSCDRRHGRPLEDCERVQSVMDEYANDFLRISMQDHWYRSYTPSRIAAASIGAARIYLLIAPPWPSSLEERTGYTGKEIYPLVREMLSTHSQHEQETDQEKEHTESFAKTGIYYTPSSRYDHRHHCGAWVWTALGGCLRDMLHLCEKCKA